MPAIFVDLFEMVPVSPTSECYSTASLTGRLGLTLMMTAYIVVGRSMPHGEGEYENQKRIRFGCRGMDKRVQAVRI